jgi:ABC-type uncharacterized transport system permease subunit
MKLTSEILTLILPVLYLIVIYVYYRIFFGKERNLSRYTVPLLLTLILVHTLEIIIRLIGLKAMLFSTAFDALSFLAFSILIVYIIIERTTKSQASGLFILSFAFLAEVISSFNHTWKMETNELLSDPNFVIHASLTVMGYTALSLSAIYALLYIIQNQNMKKRRFGVIYDQLPPIDHLELMSIHSVAVGIVLMGSGIILGHIQANAVFGAYWMNDAKIIITDIIWLLYGIGYILARVFRWRGRMMAYLSLAGFILLLIAAVMVVLTTESFHKFY